MCPPRAKLFICVVAVLVTRRWVVDFDLLSGLERGARGVEDEASTVFGHQLRQTRPSRF